MMQQPGGQEHTAVGKGERGERAAMDRGGRALLEERWAGELPSPTANDSLAQIFV